MTNFFLKDNPQPQEFAEKLNRYFYRGLIRLEEVEAVSDTAAEQRGIAPEGAEQERWAGIVQAADALVTEIRTVVGWSLIQ